MEVLKVSMEEATGLITVVFHADKVLEAKKFFKELFEDDEQATDQPQYQEYQQYQCGMCNCMPCTCGTTAPPFYEQPPTTSGEYKEIPTSDKSMDDMP